MTKIREMIKTRENEKFIFKPDRDFYKKVEINQKRWGQIVRGDVAPTIAELKAIADFFKVDVATLI